MVLLQIYICFGSSSPVGCVCLRDHLSEYLTTRSLEHTNRTSTRTRTLTRSKCSEYTNITINYHPNIARIVNTITDSPRTFFKVMGCFIAL